MLVFLIVKGEHATVLDLCERRGITPVKTETRIPNEICIWGKISSLNPVLEWFGEETPKIAGYGYTPGTLILWNLPEDGDCKPDVKEH